MRIAFIGQKGIFVRTAGGVETHVENLSLQLVDRGHEVFVYARPHFCFIRRKKYLGVNLIKLPSIPTKNLDTITHTFFSTIHALFCKYDVIHYHGVGPATLAWIARLLKPRTKIVVTFHSIDRFHKKWGWFARLYLGFGEWAACKFPHATIVVSKVLQKYCKKKFDARTTYVPNGVLIPRKPSKEPLEKWGLKPGKYILAVARLVRHKGIHYLIEAYKNLYNKEFLIRQDGFGMTNKIALAMTNGGAKLVIVGAPSFTDDYLDYLKEVAAEDPNVIFTGFQRGATLSALFANAYLYVHPSEAEGLAITILEALSLRFNIGYFGKRGGDR
jgi:glycosyltransferase involved in cell wall biosynthesis